MKFWWAFVIPPLFLAGNSGQEHLTSVDRLSESRLENTKQTRLEWSRTRVAYFQRGLYRDFRAILHVHAEDAPHTLGTRNQVLKAAKDDGVDIIMWTDHHGPKPDTWTGYREGVLFMAGSEDDHQLRFPGADGDLKFLSHLEGVPDGPTDGFAGMEIYNRHADMDEHKDLTEYVQRALKQPHEFRKLAAREQQFPDEVYAAGTDALAGYLARYDREIAKHRFTAIAANDAHRNQVFNGVVFDPYEVAFRFVSTHILARELKEDQIRQSLRDGHAYIAYDWLCDPSGFSFSAVNNFGVYDMGDRVPLLPNTRLFARFPVKAHIRLIHNGAPAADSDGAEFTFTPNEEGAYRLEASLPVAGEERPWIHSNPFYFYKPDASELAITPAAFAPDVKVIRDLTYTDGKPENASKHKLDLYLPAVKAKFPVLFFVHGGGWRTGDRSLYRRIGNRFAKEGIGVVIPSYRLAPASPPPAQIEDVAAAFAWTLKHVAEYGGDPGRIFVAGHSAGGHLVSLLALDPRYLKRYGLTASVIRGVMTLSGVYDVRHVAVFGPDEKARRTESPLEYVNSKAPPFLVTYCQWDYPGLPAQARAFDLSLRHHFVDSTLRFIPGENHINEVVLMARDDDPMAREMLKFMDGVAR